MIIEGGCFSLEVVEAVSRTTCQENTEPSSGEIFCQVDPRAHYLVRLRVGQQNSMVQDNRVFLAYVNVNDEYVGYRQCLSQREGYQDVGMISTIIGVNEPIRFQQAKLLENGGQIHSNILHMGKVTVKIYEGICDRRQQSAFGNNVMGNQAYQPGQYINSMTIHCCATPEAGHSFLNPVDADKLKKAMLKRSTPIHSEAPTSFKRVKTETGYVSVTPNSSMDCDMGVPQQAWPQQAFPLA